jgi:7-cyano-7-deazaguanine synthase
MKKTLVVLSGGQDSTTCLYWAKAAPGVQQVHAITFDYGQRHSIEIAAASLIGELAGVTTHEFVKLPDGALRGTSPLVNPDYEVGQYDSADVLPGGLEDTFVPARNLLFLALAANRAYCLGCDSLVVGVSQEDFGGYPDCRGSFIRSMQETISEALGSPFKIYAPLLDLTKRATVDLAASLDGCLDAVAHSHTCYNGEAPPCGKCHACLLRERGFEEAGIPDPLITRCSTQEPRDSK